MLDRCGIALGIATAGIAPADRKLPTLRDRTATVDSLPLIVASILSKKLATGAGGDRLRRQGGDAAFLPRLEQARDLARLLAGISSELGVKAEALLTDMNQPLGDWAGHASEIREVLDCLEGGGPRETVELTLALALALGGQIGADWTEARLRALLASGAAPASSAGRWLRARRRVGSIVLTCLWRHEVVVTARRRGWVAAVPHPAAGTALLAEAGGARRSIGSQLDLGIALHYRTALAARSRRGGAGANLSACRGSRARGTIRCLLRDRRGVAPPPLVVERVTPGAAGPGLIRRRRRRPYCRSTSLSLSAQRRRSSPPGCGARAGRALGASATRPRRRLRPRESSSTIVQPRSLALA